MFINGKSKNDISIDIYIKFLELELLFGGFNSIILDIKKDFDYNTKDFRIFFVNIPNKELFDEIIKYQNLFSCFLLKRSDNSLNSLTLSLLPNAEENFHTTKDIVLILDKYIPSEDYNKYLRYGYFLLLELEKYWDNIPYQIFEEYRRIIKSPKYNFKEYLLTRRD